MSRNVFWEMYTSLFLEVECIFLVICICQMGLFLFFLFPETPLQQHPTLVNSNPQRVTRFQTVPEKLRPRGSNYSRLCAQRARPGQLKSERQGRQATTQELYSHTENAFWTLFTIVCQEQQMSQVTSILLVCKKSSRFF